MTPGAIETRLRAIERGLSLLERGLSDELLHLRLLRQGLREAWEDAARVNEAAAPAFGPCGAGFVDAFPSVFDCIPTTLPWMLQTRAGWPIPFGTLTWGGSSLSDAAGAWTGCVMYPRPAETGCTARTIPLFARMEADPSNATRLKFTVSWIGSPCPTSAKSCADLAGVTHSAHDETPAGYAPPDPFTLANDNYAGTAPPYDFYYYYVGTNLNDFANGSQACKVWLPETITLTDSLYGACPLAWDGFSWKGCHAGIAYPGYGGAPAQTIAIHYEYPMGGRKVTVTWATSSNNPSASTCATGINSTVVVAINAGASTCSPFSEVQRYAGGGTNAMQRLYNNTTRDLVVTI